MNQMKQYLDLLQDIIHNGVMNDYGNSKRLSVYNKTLSFNMQDTFPLISSKRVAYKTAFNEMLWFLRGESFNTETLVARSKAGTNIWEQWQVTEDTGIYKKGDIGPMYGYLWRNWDGIDQFKEVIDDIKEHIKQGLTTTRFTITAYNPKYKASRFKTPQENVLDGKGALNPCHPLIQFILRYVDGMAYLSLRFDMTSSDAPIGLPFNIAGYGLLLELVSREVNAVPDYLYYVGGDIHVYDNQIDTVKEQIRKGEVNDSTPIISIDSSKSIYDITIDDIEITGYKPLKGIKYNLTT